MKYGCFVNLSTRYKYTNKSDITHYYNSICNFRVFLVYTLVNVDLRLLLTWFPIQVITTVRNADDFSQHLIEKNTKYLDKFANAIWIKRKKEKWFHLNVVGSCLPMIVSIQYRTLTNCMY